MKRLGIDIGASTVKVVVMQENRLTGKAVRKHCGKIRAALKEALLEVGETGPVRIGVTGSGAECLTALFLQLRQLEEIPMIVSGVSFLAPTCGSIINIGSQTAGFITNLDKPAPDFSLNEHCAGGTGSFFEDQMSRLDMKMEDYSDTVSKAQSVPRISGRCAVFAKTDIIHRQQEGAKTPDILLGLCYAMVRSFKSTIVRSLPIRKPVVFTGGVTQNAGMRKALQDVFSLTDQELIIPENALFAGAIGAAREAFAVLELSEILLAAEQSGEENRAYAPAGFSKLILRKETRLTDPAVSGKIPKEGVALGIDIGSTSTNLVLLTAAGELAHFQYLRTAGNPEAAVRKGLKAIREAFGELKFLSVGITGSGRERLGKMMKADAIQDEITAQAKAAVWWVPGADTVFEIGGQDSKYIFLKDGEVADFQMNKICAAGTGSFVEEQAARMNIPIREFGPLALTAEQPCRLGERCTVFIETAVASAQAEGRTQAEIAAGLCHSIVQNYLHKVVGTKPVGTSIVLQGGVAYNPGIVAAFQNAYPQNLTVSPVFSISGAFGAALLSLEKVGFRMREKNGRRELTGHAERESTFLGLDFPSTEGLADGKSAEIKRHQEFYKKTGAMLLKGYEEKRNPARQTVGVPLSLVMYKFFPLVNAFFRTLGYNVVLSGKTDEEIISLAQQFAQGETCYPVKLLYGHMAKLAEKKVDYIFMPNIHTIHHPHSGAAHNYACPYMQSAAKSIFDVLELKKKGIRLLNPVFDLDLGAQAMAGAMLGVGKSLGFSKPLCAAALMKGSLLIKENAAAQEKMGRDLMASLKPNEKVPVLITRNYGFADPVLNMGIPEMLLSKGYRVLNLSHLPGTDMDLNQDYPNMYWPFGEHILAGAKLIACHPNLYAVYLTSHGCGPDTLLQHMFAEEMGDKPYLQIEVDEHFSPVGVATRIEAFLNSISHHHPPKVENVSAVGTVHMHTPNLLWKPDKEKTLFLPNLGWYTGFLEEYFSAYGCPTKAMEDFTKQQHDRGRAETRTREYLPFAMLAGAILETLERETDAGRNPEELQFLIPFNEGADADGQYARAIRAVLDRNGYEKAAIIAPVLEKLPLTAKDPDLLMRAIAAGDLYYTQEYDIRRQHPSHPGKIPSWKELEEAAERIGGTAVLRSGEKIRRPLGAVGSPLTEISLNDGMLEVLEKEGKWLLRAPLSEALLFLWKDAAGKRKASPWLTQWEQRLSDIGKRLGTRNPWAESLQPLLAAADQYLEDFSAANGRYRFAKAVSLGEEGKASAVLLTAPRYENTAMVLNMRKLYERCRIPVADLAVDGDPDKAERTRLGAFLYYIE